MHGDIIVEHADGERFETYLIEGDAGSGVMCMNGAAARRVQPGDMVIVIAYGMYDEQESQDHVPLVVLCDERNKGVMLNTRERSSLTADELLSSLGAR
jgi:aspartate 1-decarboxylase